MALVDANVVGDHTDAVQTAKKIMREASTPLEPSAEAEGLAYSAPEVIQKS